MKTSIRSLAAALTAVAALALAACQPAAESASPSASATADAATFPVTIDHKFGTTTIESAPERVISVGYHEQDWLYAFGVAPIAVREWYGGYDYATWPWADAAREAVGATPEVLPNGELNFEQIAALQPDLIVATWSGITEEDYSLLAQIAPVVAQSGDYADYGMPFEEETMLIATALGKADEGAQLIADIDAQYAAAADAHPDWAGKTGAVAFVYEGQPGAYLSHDPRSRVLAQLGLDTSVIDAEASADSFYLSVSPERLDIFDLDAVVWLAALAPDTKAQVEAMPQYESLGITQAGGHIWESNGVFEGAFSFSSPLSQAYVLEVIVPQLEAALDGDPATEIPEAPEAG